MNRIQLVILRRKLYRLNQIVEKARKTSTPDTLLLQYNNLFEGLMAVVNFISYDENEERYQLLSVNHKHFIIHEIFNRISHKWDILETIEEMNDDDNIHA